MLSSIYCWVIIGIADLLDNERILRESEVTRYSNQRERAMTIEEYRDSMKKLISAKSPIE